MSTLGQAGKVGLLVVGGAILVIAMLVWFRGGLLPHTYNIDVLFDDASGIDKDAPVTLAGVQVGKVDHVSLTPAQKADLQLEIKDSQHIPVGSQFSIVTPILGSAGTVIITPPSGSEAVLGRVIQPGAAGLTGQRSVDISSAFSKANQLLTQLSDTTRRSDKLIDALTQTAMTAKNDLGGPQVQHTLDNLSMASSNGVLFTAQINKTLADDNAQLQSLLRQTGSGERAILGNLTQTTGQLNSLAAENRGKLNDVVSNLQDTTSSLAGITGQINQSLKDGNAPQSLGATIKNLKTASDNLVLISDNFAKLSSDQGVQDDLRATLHNVRESTDATDALLGRLGEIAGVKHRASVIVTPGGSVIVHPGQTTPGGRPQVRTSRALIAPALLPRLDLVQDLRDHHFRTDLDTVIPLPGSSQGAFARIGVYGFGDTNRGILEYGEALDPQGLFDARVGLYASKLSLGGDIGLGHKATLSLDAWDPNLLHLDTRGTYLLGNGFGLQIGEEDILRHAAPTVGLEYRR
jgi:phospholipid/cholesterol/gamma-HCH transport system substrate-binding protein